MSNLLLWTFLQFQICTSESRSANSIKINFTPISDQNPSNQWDTVIKAPLVLIEKSLKKFISSDLKIPLMENLSYLHE